MIIRVLIADDHDVVREGLKTFLSLDAELEVIGTVANGKEAIEFAEKVMPDVVLMDLDMPEVDGYAATTELRRRYPGLQVLILTATLEPQTITHALQAGASGYLTKNMDSEALCRAVKSAANSQVVFSPQAASMLAGASNNKPAIDPETKIIPSVTVRAGRESNEILTNRENEVLQLLAEGSTNKEIGYRLGLSERTIKVHVSVIMAKLNAQSRTQAVLLAARLGMLSNLQVTEESKN